MPNRYRGPRKFNTVHHKYLEDLREAALTVNAAAVEMYLMLSPSSNMAGVWRESPYTIAQYIGLSPLDVQNALCYLADSNRIFLFAGDWIFLPAKWRFDPAFPGSNDQIKGIANILALAPQSASDAFKLCFRDFQSRLFSILSEDLHFPAICNTGTTRDTGTGTGTIPSNSHNSDSPTELAIFIANSLENDLSSTPTHPSSPPYYFSDLSYHPKRKSKK